ncbi:MAG: hypothetical protein WA790_15250 [Sulfitobacter sp.]
MWALFATTAHAGAWMREKGTSFTSLSFTTNYFLETTNASYLEFGWRENLTIGADIGYATNSQGIQTGYGTLFIRRPLGPNKGQNKWAYELGVGAAWIGDIVLPHLKTGVSWGRGLQIKDMNGWMAIDASMTWDVSYGQHIAKVDSTVGVNFTEITTGMVELYLANLNSKTYATIAPSLVFKPRKGKYRFQIGAESPLGEVENTALKLGLWREF